MTRIGVVWQSRGSMLPAFPKPHLPSCFLLHICGAGMLVDPGITGFLLWGIILALLHQSDTGIPERTAPYIICVGAIPAGKRKS